MKYADYIKEIEIDALWSGRKHIKWTLDPQVNILSGVNGDGKSTILRRAITGAKTINAIEKQGIRLVTEPSDAEYIRYNWICTPDVRSEYDENLQGLLERYNGNVNGNGNGNDTLRYDTAQAPTIRPAGYDNGNVNGNGKLAEDLDGATDALDGFVFAEEGGDVEHAWSLTLADEAEAEGVHDVAEFVALVLNPLEDDGFLGLDGEVVDGLEEVSELCHDLC